jgi:hypothetical protein
LLCEQLIGNPVAWIGPKSDLTGIGPVGKAKIARSPELKSQGNATTLFVFGL